MPAFPKITIITPSFNQGQYLEQTIQSILDQQYSNLEYIIIDGGSTDNSIEIIKKYEKYLAYWISEKDAGQSDAVNKGLRKATGDIINWLNSDDYYEPNTLIKVSQYFKNTEVNVVCGKSRIFTDINGTIKLSSGTDLYPENLAKTIGWARIDQPETFFRSEVVKQMGLLDVRLHYVMDRDWWIKYLFLFGLNGIIKIPDVLVNFRWHESSKTISKASLFQIEQDSLYYSLAKSFKMNKYCEIIENVCTVNKDFSQPFFSESTSAYLKDVSLVEKIINYYFLLRANQFYVVNERRKAQQLLNIIDHYMLDTDKMLWLKLAFRNKYIPLSVIHWFRRNRL